MPDTLENQVQSYCTRIKQVDTLPQLEQLRVELLGKRGLLTGALRSIGTLPARERVKTGKLLHQLKQSVNHHLETKKQALTESTVLDRLCSDQVDVSLPARGQPIGAIHPLTKVRTQIEDFFINLGFTLKTGPEVETDAINFTALNIPAHHPARTLHDTFYIDKQLNTLLRTHTSTVQVHTLAEQRPPLRAISTGPVYRCDSDVTHTPMFHQLDGMVLDTQSTFSELKGLLTYFLRTFFKDEHLITRFRVSYFPFTEPSAEMDIQCVLCAGKTCPVCSHTGWLEVLGCGMIHPNVLHQAKVDPKVYQGYAFGIGIERLTLLLYRIPDIRLLFENDRRLLNQFT